MSQQLDNMFGTFTAGEALEAFRRVRLSAATEKTIVYADAGEPHIGVTQDVVASGSQAEIKMANAPGTFKVTASAAITVNAKVYGAADGKVSETVSGSVLFIAREAASANNAVIECFAASHADARGGAAALRDFQDSVTNRLTAPTGSDTVGDRILVIATASGVFTGQENNIAVLEQDASWTFIPASEGMMTYVEDEDIFYEYNGSAWVTLVEFGGIALADAGNITTGTSTGSKIGTATAQKIGFWNATPVVQQNHIADPAATQDSLTDNTGGSANTTLTAVTAAATITDNSGGTDPGDDTIAAVTNNNAITDNSGGVDPADDTIAAVTNVDTLTDSTGGTVDNTVAADAGICILTIPIPDMVQFADGDIVTEIVPGFAGKILSAFWLQEDPVTTGAKGTTLNIEIETTNVTGGVITLTSAACTPLGKYIAGTAITDNNTFAAAEKISIEATSTTAFIEGSGAIVLVCCSTAVNDNFKELADQIITQKAANTAILAAVAQIAAKVNVLTTAVTAITAATKQLSTKQNTTSTAVASSMNNFADIAAQLAKAKTDIDANNTAIDSINALCATIGITAAS